MSRSGSDLSTCTTCGGTLVWDWYEREWVHVDTGQSQCTNWTDDQEALYQEHAGYSYGKDDARAWFDEYE